MRTLVNFNYSEHFVRIGLVFEPKQRSEEGLLVLSLFERCQAKTA